MKNIRKVIFLFVFVITAIGVVGAYENYHNRSEEAVQLVTDKVLIPGGQSVGIKMDVKGVLVVGLEEIETDDAIVNPGLDAGVQVGDVILTINGQEVFYPQEVSEIVRKSDGILDVEILREKEKINCTIKAAKDFDSKEYKLGIWVKEKIAGIGTLSFYDPETNMFAALGHGIYERKTNTLVNPGSGQLLKTEVKSIKEGLSGVPGEIRGIFCDEDKPLGAVITNSKYGIYSVGSNIEELELIEPLPVASQEQIKVGKAYILTTIEGDTVEKFEIRIERINKQDKIDGKGLEIRVIDDRLLERCGGIVQGMSGSPIIQDGKLVGAVTHVLVNDPTRGYGIFIEHMINMK